MCDTDARIATRAGPRGHVTRIPGGAAAVVARGLSRGPVLHDHLPAGAVLNFEMGAREVPHDLAPLDWAGLRAPADVDGPAGPIQGPRAAAPAESPTAAGYSATAHAICGGFKLRLSAANAAKAPRNHACDEAPRPAAAQPRFPVDAYTAG